MFEDRRELLENPLGVERQQTVVTPVDERVVASSWIHRESGLDGVPAVVTIDQIVHFVEARAPRNGAPTASETCSVAFALPRQRPPLQPKRRLVILGPLLAWHQVGLDLLWTGVFGGSAAYAVHRLNEAFR